MYATLQGATQNLLQEPTNHTVLRVVSTKCEGGNIKLQKSQTLLLSKSDVVYQPRTADIALNLKLA